MFTNTLSQTALMRTAKRFIFSPYRMKTEKKNKGAKTEGVKTEGVKTPFTKQGGRRII